MSINVLDKIRWIDTGKILNNIANRAAQRSQLEMQRVQMDAHRQKLAHERRQREMIEGARREALVNGNFGPMLELGLTDEVVDIEKLQKSGRESRDALDLKTQRALSQSIQSVQSEQTPQAMQGRWMAEKTRLLQLRSRGLIGDADLPELGRFDTSDIMLHLKDPAADNAALPQVRRDRMLEPLNEGLLRAQQRIDLLDPADEKSELNFAGRAESKRAAEILSERHPGELRSLNPDVARRQFPDEWPGALRMAARELQTKRESFAREGRPDPLGKTATQRIQLETKNSLQQLAELRTLKSLAKPEHFTIVGRGKAALTALGERVGFNPSTGSTEHLKAMEEAFNVAENLFNLYRKDITGAQAAFKELEMLRDTFPTMAGGGIGGVWPKKSWTQFTAALDQRVNMLMRRVRLNRRVLASKGASLMTEDEIIGEVDGLLNNPSAQGREAPDIQIRIDTLNREGIPRYRDQLEILFSEGYIDETGYLEEIDRLDSGGR